jgi:hypothetical protein
MGKIIVCGPSFVFIGRSSGVQGVVLGLYV